jgi:hypothetical protein
MSGFELESKTGDGRDEFYNDATIAKVLSENDKDEDTAAAQRWRAATPKEAHPMFSSAFVFRPGVAVSPRGEIC